MVPTPFGNVRISPDAILALKRKTWLPLSTFTYPSTQVEHDFQHTYAAHLITQLHRTFRATGYTAFTGILSIAHQTVNNVGYSAVSLTTHRAEYIRAIHASVKDLSDVKNPHRVALQHALNAELNDLYSSWNIAVSLYSDPGPIAYKFIYDPDSRQIIINPHEWISGAPSEYPDKVGNTSELSADDGHHAGNASRGTDDSWQYGDNFTFVSALEVVY